MRLPQTPGALVLRTDFHDDSTWEALCDRIARSSVEGFSSSFTFVTDLAWADLPGERLTQFEPPPSFYFVVDRVAIEHSEHPILAVDLEKDRWDRAGGPRTFRLLPSEATSLACNLDIANMDFWEFADNVGPDGIFRGFGG